MRVTLRKNPCRRFLENLHFFVGLKPKHEPHESWLFRSLVRTIFSEVFRLGLALRIKQCHGLQNVRFAGFIYTNENTTGRFKWDCDVRNRSEILNLKDRK